MTGHQIGGRHVCCSRASHSQWHQSRTSHMRGKSRASCAHLVLAKLPQVHAGARRCAQVRAGARACARARARALAYLHGDVCMGMCAWACVHGHVCIGTCAWACVHGDVCMGMRAWACARMHMTIIYDAIRSIHTVSCTWLHTRGK